MCIFDKLKNLEKNLKKVLTFLKECDIISKLSCEIANKLVLMTTQIYLVQALDSHEMPTPEKWMKGIRWFSFAEALDAIEYDDIEKLMLIAKKKIRSGDY